MAGIFKFTKFALKNLFTKPATRAYPSVPARQTPRTRGAVQVNIGDCIFCGLCNRRCPADAITVDRANKSWSIKRMSCVQCGNCVLNCPKKCLTMEGAYSAPGCEKRSELFCKAEAPIPAVHTLAPAPADGKAIAPDRVLVIDMTSCVLCGLCARRCPTGALCVDRKAGTWTVDRAACLQCGNCVNGCHKHSLSKTTEGIDVSGVQVYSKGTASAPATTSDSMAEASPDRSKIESSAPVPLIEVSATDAQVGNGIAIDLSTCVFCGLCAKKCPTSAITVDRAMKTWSIDREGCVLCAGCITACPKKSLSEAEIPLLELYTK